MLLRAERLQKNYGMNETQIKALRSIDLTLEEGDFTAIIGQSGSGKSTLLHLLAGLDKPSSGYVFIENENITKMKDKELATFRRRNIGFVFQAFNLIPILSVEENICLPLLMDKEEVEEPYLNELLEVLDLRNRRNHLPGEISGGQQQRTAIARALIAKPKIIFADEPTGNLDSKNSTEVMELFTKSIKKYHQTLVLITHDPKVAAYADRVITLQDGEIVEDRRGCS